MIATYFIGRQVQRTEGGEGRVETDVNVLSDRVDELTRLLKERENRGQE